MKKLVRTVLVSILFLGILLLFNSYQPELEKEQVKQELEYQDSRYMDNVNGNRVHYHIKGKGEPLVLIHGAGANIHHFDLVRDKLSKEYKVITFDNLGHGLTGPDAKLDYSNQNFLSFLEVFFDRLGLNQFYLGGNSFGGYLSALYAQKNPDKVKKLILIDAYGGKCESTDYSKSPFFIEGLPVVRDLVKYFFPKFMVESELNKHFYEPATEKMVNDTFSAFSVKGNRAFRYNLFQYDHPREAIEAKQLNDLPILLLWGEKDETHDMCEANDLEQRLHNDTLVVLKKTGHLPMLENPRETQKAMLTFLSEN